MQPAVGGISTNRLKAFEREITRQHVLYTLHAPLRLFVPTYTHCMVQIRRHGTEHDDWQGGRRSVLTEWSSCDCSSGASDRL